ncbi:MAG: adenylate/guanylate cyclase domain-containing protein [Candidatus Tectomicrobia bacterium]
MTDARRPSGVPPESPESILLVDDNPTNLHVLFQALRGRGYQLLIAKSGAQALHIARQVQPVLILLDILMPGLDGYETCRQLKADPVTREAAVIFLSALGETHDKVRGLELGAVDYITKPFQVEEVNARVTTHLTIHRLQQQLARRNHALDTANRFIRQIFGRYVTDEVVASVLDDPDGLELGGEERTVTILVSDLRGFTSLATQLGPTQVMALLNRYLGTMVDVIMAHEGTIDEIMGDGIFVLFGAPRRREDDACRAVGCAVAMQLAMDEVNAQNRREGLPEVEMGIGIHTGTVVVGNIGSPKRTKYGAVGSHVNLASRIESYTTGNQILISATTHHEVGPLLRIDGQMQVEPKGVHAALTLYDVGGIGAPYHRFLPESHATLVPLDPVLVLRYTVLEEKHVGRTVFTGHLVQLSAKGGVIRSAHPVPVLSNIKIWLTTRTGEALPGDLYGKVVPHPTTSEACFAVRFTSRAPDITVFLQDVLRAQE